MPKEIVHLYLADRLWELFQSVTSVKLGAVGKILFMIGALFPDSFFYSPFSVHYSTGDSLHNLEGRAFYDLARDRIWNNSTPEEKVFIAGMITHFLADGHWHPTINYVAEKMAEKLPGGFSQVFYHRLLESFMQACLISRTEQNDRIIWLKSNYADAIPVATSVLSKLLSVIEPHKKLSTNDVRIIVFCHEMSLRALHSSVMREKRAWFANITYFQSFSPLIPPSDDEYGSFSALIPAEKEKVDFIFSQETVDNYIKLVSSLFHELL